MRHEFLLAAAFCIATGTVPAAADTITVAQAHAAVEREIACISKNYVMADKRAALIAVLRANEAAGRYDLTDPAALAEALGADTTGTTHDKHMWVRYSPAEFEAMQHPAKPGGDDFFKSEEARTNQGYAELRILPGNVRYLNLTNFGWDGKQVPQAVTDAARFLGGGDAVIIDLRQNGGGSPAAVRALISYFMPAKPQLLMSFHDGTTGKVETSSVTLKLPAPRLAGKPLYVLTSSGTGSAAEEFSYHVKAFRLGTLVGETTAGAANNNTTYALAAGVIGSISTGLTVHGLTHGNWEGAGVAPDVATPAAKALDQAQLLALQRLAALPGAHKAEIDYGIAWQTARLAPPPKLDAAALAAYAGAYGLRTITVQDGALLYQRQGRAQKAMVPMTADLFTLGDGDPTLIRFRQADGKIAGFDLLTPEGEVLAVDRTP